MGPVVPCRLFSTECIYDGLLYLGPNYFVPVSSAFIVYLDLLFPQFFFSVLEANNKDPYGVLSPVFFVFLAHFVLLFEALWSKFRFCSEALWSTFFLYSRTKLCGAPL